MKLKFDLKMLVEVRDLEIEGKNEEDCMNKLELMLAEEIINCGIVENSDLIDYCYEIDDENIFDYE